MKTIPYATQWITKEDVDAVSSALRSAYLTQGPKVEEFERLLAEYCGAKYAVAVNSGTSALHIACLAAGLKKGDEGITSPITFVASANCMLYCGAKPVFADIDLSTACIDPAEIEKKITKRTKVLIPVHFAGQPCDMKKIASIAKKHKLRVIEDACHALGAEYHGDRIGSCKYSDMAVLSFHAVKHITTGEGGAVLTNNKETYKKLKLFRSHGITRDVSRLSKKNSGGWYYEMQALGFNYRLTELQSALGASQLKKLDRFVNTRRKIAKKYDNAFRSMDSIDVLFEKEKAASSYHLYVIRVKNRKKVFEKLRSKGIGVNVHYIPVFLQPYYRALGYKKEQCPAGRTFYEEAISLPMYPKLTEKEVQYVIDMVKESVQ